MDRILHRYGTRTACFFKRRAILFPDRNVWTIGERPSLVRSLRAFHDHLKTAGESISQGLLCGCLNLIRELVDADQEPDPDRDLLQEACQYLGESFHEKRNLQSFCLGNSVGYERLRKLFTARMGVSPHRYRIRRRMDRATQLLQDTHRSIGDIAYELGVRDTLRIFITISPRIPYDSDIAPTERLEKIELR